MSFDYKNFSVTLVKSMPEAVIYADAEGKIEFWNDGAERMFGFSRADALGQSLDLIIPETLRQRHREGFDKTMHTGQSRYGAGEVLAVPAIRNDGSRISIEFTIVPFKNEAGMMVGIAAVIRDVTKRFEEIRNLRKRVATRE